MQQSGRAPGGGVWLTSTATVMSSEVPSQAQAVQVQPVELKTIGWALRRAALGLGILIVATGFFAWLLYASIEPEAGAPGAQSEYALPPS